MWDLKIQTKSIMFITWPEEKLWKRIKSTDVAVSAEARTEGKQLEKLSGLADQN